MSDEPLVLTEQRGYVQILTLNRPDAMNSFNMALSEALGEALDNLDANPDVRVGVLTGAGRGFSAGMDLKAFVSGGGIGAMPNPPGRGFGGIAERSAAKPLIAAVERFALAGGLEVALSLKSGACWVNSHNLFDAAAGFGGYRESGFGRDGGKEVRVRTCPGYWELKGLYKHVAQLERS